MPWTRSASAADIADLKLSDVEELYRAFRGPQGGGARPIGRHRSRTGQRLWCAASSRTGLGEGQALRKVPYTLLFRAGPEGGAGDAPDAPDLRLHRARPDR